MTIIWITAFASIEDDFDPVSKVFSKLKQFESFVYVIKIYWVNIWFDLILLFGFI